MDAKFDPQDSLREQEQREREEQEEEELVKSREELLSVVHRALEKARFELEESLWLVPPRESEEQKLLAMASMTVAAEEN